MAVGDIYEVTDVQQLYDQQVLNVYFYQQEGAFVPLSGTVAQALADEWETTVLPGICIIQSSDLLHVEIRVRNLFDDTDQGVAVSGATGTVGNSDTAPAFVSLGYGLKGDNASVRDGAKRLGGISEASILDGVLATESLTAANLAAAAIEAPITGGLIIEDDIMFPVVVKRVREGTEGNYTYRLPENSGELTVSKVIEVLLNLIITSQISRKIGVGL